MTELASVTVACRTIALDAQSSDQTVKSAKAVERPGMLLSWKNPVMAETPPGPVAAKPMMMKAVTLLSLEAIVTTSRWTSRGFPKLGTPDGQIGRVDTKINPCDAYKESSTPVVIVDLKFMDPRG